MIIIMNDTVIKEREREYILAFLLKLRLFRL